MRTCTESTSAPAKRPLYAISCVCHHEHDIGSAAYPAGVQLTGRETEVLALVARGYMNKEIADRLQIGLTTVISHRRNIMEKLGIRSVAGLAIYAMTAGYVAVDEL